VQSPGETRYARSGDIHIAYQVVGSGPFDLVFVPGYVTHLELAWRLPTFAPVLAEMASFARLIKFDKRGTGMSDPVRGAPTLETRMDDVRAVMDAVGSRRAALYGLSDGASMSVLFAATYPERIAALVLRSPIARTLWAPDYPWGYTAEDYEEQIRRELRIYGPRAEALAAVRSLGSFDDSEAEDFLDYLRYGASPGMLEALLRMNRDIDVRHVLPAVRVPTLILQGGADELMPSEAARHLAALIPGARFTELPDVGHLALGGGDRIIEEARGFLTAVWEDGGWEESEPDRMLATVLFTDIVDATGTAIRLGDRAWRDLLERHHAIVRRELSRHRGREIDTVGDGFFAAFDGPARAIRCACAIVARVREMGVEVRAGLHTGECEIADGKVAGIAVHTGARVASQAQAGEVLVSNTVKDLVAGSGIEFDGRGAHRLQGIPGEWRLYAARCP
jgi:pimeloyl-ACP methyl ester carboxylesterase/class 3 adenylate cyclase